MCEAKSPRSTGGLKAAKEDRKNARIAQAHVGQWRTSKAKSLWDVYGTYSTRKAAAFRYCKDLQRELNGSALRILSANSQAFTVGFFFKDPETGEGMFAYITKDYDRFCYADITSEEVLSKTFKEALEGR